MPEQQGAHYKVVPGEQHHERAIRLGLNWYAANITKYAERAPHKGQQIEDLIKVLDYTCMWLASDDKETNPVRLSHEQLQRICVIVGKVGLRNFGSERIVPNPTMVSAAMERHGEFVGSQDISAPARESRL